MEFIALWLGMMAVSYLLSIFIWIYFWENYVSVSDLVIFTLFALMWPAYIPASILIILWEFMKILFKFDGDTVIWSRK